MLFSCKITNSLIISLDRRGEDLTVFHEQCDWPAEFLRDPSSWLEADKMEQLLQQFDVLYSRDEARGIESHEPLIMSIGHESKDLRAWGVLDSVLRMVQAPKDLFAQPERFLSYFVSPAPPVGDIHRASDSVSFVLPISAQQYPRVTMFLRAALEALPTYIGKPMASVVWDDSLVTITWSENQASLFGEAPAVEMSLNPELVRNIVADLETSQKELEQTKKRLLQAERELEQAQNLQTIQLPLQETPAMDLEASVGDALYELYRLGDYFARGQQLVTMLVAQGRLSPPVQEAMRRVDWPHVCEATPLILRHAIDELVQLRDRAREVQAALPQTSGARLDRSERKGAQGSFFSERRLNVPPQSPG